MALAPLAYIVAGIVLGLFAAGFTAMSMFIKNAGAFYTYISRGLGRPVGLGAALLAVFSYNSLQIAIYGAFAVFAQKVFLDVLGLNVAWPLIVIIALIATTWLGVRNITLSANVLGVVLIAECTILIIVAAAILLKGGGPDGLSLAPLAPSHLFSPGMGAMFLFTFSTFIGFEATAIFSEEALSPEKTIPRATYIAIAFLAIFYAFIVWAIISGYGSVAAVAMANSDPTGMYFAAAEQYVGHWAKMTMEVFILLSMFACLLAFHNFVARYQFALAREGIFPKVFARTHPQYKSPWISSLFQSLLALLFIVPFWMAGADPFNDFFVPVTTPGIYGVLVLQVLTALAVMSFFRFDRHGLSLWRTLVAPALSAVVMGMILYFAVANVELITGKTGEINFWLPTSVPMVFVIGVVIAWQLKRRKSPRYERFAQDA
ncbi:APC family permease [Pseudomonas sp. 32A]|uniref:APC family permease n=1 Tax=Pseudomonas sp. 32A TaxID=651185 RepID=UPI004046141F